MWISRFRIVSYSSFADSGWINLAPGANLFIGPNNSGKSALLRALTPPLASVPHRNSESFRDGEVEQSLVELDIHLRLKELFLRFSSIGVSPNFPGLNGTTRDVELLRSFLQDPAREIVLEGQRRAKNATTPRRSASIPELRGSQIQAVFSATPREDGYSLSRIGGEDNLLSFVDAKGSGGIFYFSAQRLNVAKSSYAEVHQLAPDASNLPAVLAYLQGSRRATFERVERHISEIMPGIAAISVTPSGNDFEILVWPERQMMNRELAFSLEDSGTGVGQLLAILTAVVTSEYSVIVIDEINTFLHPAAVKKLLLTLRSEYSHHQYIISTHSSEVISSARAETIHLVEKIGYKSQVKEVAPSDVNDVRRVANLLGFSLMDAFGYERIVWIEGQTEEICLPFLLRSFNFSVPSGMGFSAVAATDAFSSRGMATKSVINLYDHVASAVSPLLLGMAFGLDRERLSDDAVAKLERSKRKLRFLPRRCIECYLIDPTAIAAVISSNLLSDGENLTPEQVEAYLIEHGGDQDLGGGSAWKGNLSAPEWLKKVDGARLLSRCFSSLSNERVEFRKTRDSYEIMRQIISVDRERLRELYEYTHRLVEIALRDSPA